MVVSWRWTLVVLVDAGVWALWSLMVGWVQSRRPWTSLRPGPLARIGTWERGGSWYRERLRLKRWKHRLPEAGTWFGGLSKRQMPAGSEGGRDRFAAECLRAERTHGWILAITPLFALWNPIGLFVANLGFAVIANLPCLVVARSNRARLEAVASRRRMRDVQGVDPER